MLTFLQTILVVMQIFLLEEQVRRKWEKQKRPTRFKRYIKRNNRTGRSQNGR